MAGLFEYVLGLRADAPNARLLWDVRLLEEHGVRRYPFGREGVLDLLCASRGSSGEEPRVRARSSVPLELTVRWAGGERHLRIPGGRTPEATRKT